MATALVSGGLRAEAMEAREILGFDPEATAAEAFTAATGAATVADMAELADREVLLLCTKPHQAANALAALPDFDGLLISVAAGLTLEWLETNAPAGCRVIRCMPNTPALVGHGAAAYARGSTATSADAGVAHALLAAVGLAFEVPESLLNAVTGLSGSGPAYAFLMIEALADGGVRCGLPRDTALALAAQTLRGAAAMVADTGTHPAVLRDRVASPGGTTIEGLAALEENGVRHALIEAVRAARDRAGELGKA